jgi:hypothetical protein
MTRQPRAARWAQRARFVSRSIARREAQTPLIDVDGGNPAA